MLAEAIQELHPQAIAEVTLGDGGDYRLGWVDGVHRIVYWNEAKLGPKPTPIDLARGWYLHTFRFKKAEFAARGVAAMRRQFPEVEDLKHHHPDLNDADVAIWMFVMLMFSNAADPKATGVKSNRDKMVTKMGQVEAKKPSASPTQAEYEKLASEVAAMSWET